MHPLIVTPMYAAVLALLFLALSVRVIVVRRLKDVGFGYAEDDALRRSIRVHANFAEYVPFALLLMGMAEARGAAGLWLHAAGVLLLAGRVAHAIGLSRSRTDEFGRIAGMTGTQTAIAIALVLILVG